MSFFNCEIQLNAVRIQSSNKRISIYSDNVTVNISKDKYIDIAYIHICVNNEEIIVKSLDEFKWIEESSIDGMATIKSSSSTMIIMFYDSNNKRTSQFFNQLNRYLGQETSDNPIDSIRTRKENRNETTDERLLQRTPLRISRQSDSSIRLRQGDLVTQNTDVIVVCISSQYLFDTICKAGGESLRACFNAKLNRNSNIDLIDVKAEGQLRSKRVYFLSWEKNSDQSLLRKSIREFVRNAIVTATSAGYQSIAFPAIGCGQCGCPTSLVAEVMVEEAYHLLRKHDISVLFVIQPQKNDIYDEFEKQINFTKHFTIPSQLAKTVSVPINQGIVSVEIGDVVTQKVDVIVVSSSSQNLRDAIINASGEEVRTAYNAEYKNNPNAILISTLTGNLPSKQIFFVKWQPDKDVTKLRQSLIDFVWTVIQNIIAYKLTSVAFPAIGCGKHTCSVDIVVKTLVKEIKNQLSVRDLQLTVKFVIQADQQDVYDKFCKQILSTQEVNVPGLTNYQIPLTWENSSDRRIRFSLSNTSDEYVTVANSFAQAMEAKCTRIIRIERIQNERWYIQYLAHSHQFLTRLNKNTERRLYHGCPESAVTPIANDCFNRSFAGVNGTLYGVGVYFSSKASYSHGYTKENSKGERHMFVARVLIGNTTKGNSSMRTRPDGYDSTTDGDHIFVTYHDAQSYAEYLITYK